MARAIESKLGGRMLDISALHMAGLQWILQSSPKSSGYFSVRALDHPRFLSRHWSGPVDKSHPQKPLNLPLPVLSSASSYGCLGYAVNLIRIEGSEAASVEYLRCAVWYPALGNTLVFEDGKRMLEWAGRRDLAHFKNAAISLDLKNVESDGGSRLGSPPAPPCSLMGVDLQQVLSSGPLDPRWQAYAANHRERRVLSDQKQQLQQQVSGTAMSACLELMD